MPCHGTVSALKVTHISVFDSLICCDFGLLTRPIFTFTPCFTHLFNLWCADNDKKTMTKKYCFMLYNSRLAETGNRIQELTRQPIKVHLIPNQPPVKQIALSNPPAFTLNFFRFHSCSFRSFSCSYKHIHPTNNRGCLYSSFPPPLPPYKRAQCAWIQCRLANPLLKINSTLM